MTKSILYTNTVYAKNVIHADNLWLWQSFTSFFLFISSYFPSLHWFSHPRMKLERPTPHQRIRGGVISIRPPPPVSQSGPVMPWLRGMVAWAWMARSQSLVLFPPEDAKKTRTFQPLPALAQCCTSVLGRAALLLDKLCCFFPLDLRLLLYRPRLGLIPDQTVLVLHLYLTLRSASSVPITCSELSSLTAAYDDKMFFQEKVNETLRKFNGSTKWTVVQNLFILQTALTKHTL